MPHPCVVCGRSRMNPSNRAEEYTFFGFPVNDEPRCKKWLEFCCREELYKLSKKKLLQRMVCSKHFLRTDFLNDFNERLNNNAVPSLYDAKQSLYNISCVLCGRFRKDPPDDKNDGTSFHHFPGEEFRCLDWLKFVGVESYYRLTRKEIMFCYICSKHFDKSQFMIGFQNRLIDSAIPNIKHPSEDEEDIKQECHMTNAFEGELFGDLSETYRDIEPLPSNVLKGQVCAECGRSRNDPKNKSLKCKFHPFPAYEIGRCLKWCQFLGREDILKLSPNQIRKLVLCSAHFQIGQSFNAGNGSCDAVPTIKKGNVTPDPLPTGSAAVQKRSKFERASVSSKKPKMDPSNKPTPLAKKKRGKSKRPTIINIPKPVPRLDNGLMNKLPIPSVGNWKILSNQFQPLGLSNKLISNVTTESGKVFIPIPEDISTLGDPIHVDSLANIPPGYLIKIELPETNKIDKLDANSGKRKSKQNQSSSQSFDQSCEEGNMRVDVKIEDMTGDLQDQDYSESMLADETEAISVCSPVTDNEEDAQINVIKSETIYAEEWTETPMDKELPKYRMPSKPRCRRTLIPIQNELRRFLNKLKPLVQKLPRKSRARVKLAIVNGVIERL
ncbi:hypothetical protein QAD02_022782 [Eretmocerus hayati]|uniref:Uncharacterized protein n=1 Tax=Eretmocerus hayati TaxID=131215 RepID=A0ACC2PV39_9HYME|nr:hypothetical protein QAD02_022782 [Eretmocerus hayati]